jgi:nitrogen fixation protein NifU and related proteins
VNIYRETILDHYKNPRNKGHLENPTVSVCAENPMCGDSLCLSLIISNEVVTDIKFNGDGCAISQASASLLTENVKGKKLEDIENIDQQTVLGWLGGEITPARMKCALLAYETLKQSLAEL